LAFDTLHRLVDRLGRLPGAYHLRQSRFRARFQRGLLGHAFEGLFADFATAQANVPSHMPNSYDNEAAAGMYVDWLEITDYDYPALVWLQHSLAGGMQNVADIGGSTGIKFHAFDTVLNFPATGRWLVVEVPATARLGRRLAAEKGTSDALQFTEQIADASGCEVLLASGSLQYLPISIGEVIEGLGTKPKRVIINTTPIHPHRSFFTLNSIGTACCPYRVTSRDEFVDQLVGAGYRLRDEWRNIDKRLDLPFEQGCSLNHYTGFCFDLIEP
jgi:putative methyltransferase (TIGR04325 family)